MDPMQYDTSTQQPTHNIPNVVSPPWGQVAPTAKAKVVRPWWAIGLIAIAALALPATSATAAYMALYQRPDVVLSDSIVHLLTEKSPITADGTFTMDTEEVAVTVTLASKSKTGDSATATTVTLMFKKDELTGKSLTVKANEVHTKDGIIYLKLSDLKQAANDLIDMYSSATVENYSQLGGSMTVSEARKSLHESVDPIVQKFDGQWIKFDPSNFDEDMGTNDKTYDCTVEALKKFQNESDVKELQDVYMKHPFLNVTKELGMKDGSLGYEIKYDEAKGKAFSDASKDTSIVKALDACGIDSGEQSTTSTEYGVTDNSTVEVWVNMWSHKLTAVKYDGSLKEGSAGKEWASLHFDSTIAYNKPVTIETPKNAKTFKELLESLYSAGSTVEI